MAIRLKQVVPVPEIPTIEDKKKIQISLERKDGKTLLRFEIDPRIEEIYKKQKHEIKTSDSWNGLKFYYMPQIVRSEVYRRKLMDRQLKDDYGTSIYDGHSLNIAWLRTVGGKGEIVLGDEMSIAEASMLIRNATAFIKDYFETYYKNFKISGSVNIEL
jgi:hypothetical protein